MPRNGRARRTSESAGAEACAATPGSGCADGVCAEARGEHAAVREQSTFGCGAGGYSRLPCEYSGAAAGEEHSAAESLDGSAGWNACATRLGDGNSADGFGGDGAVLGCDLQANRDIVGERSVCDVSVQKLPLLDRNHFGGLAFGNSHLTSFGLLNCFRGAIPAYLQLMLERGDFQA